MILLFAALLLFILAAFCCVGLGSYLDKGWVAAVGFFMCLCGALCMMAQDIYASNIEGSESIKQHSIQACDNSDKCFKRIVFETCIESSQGYDCKIVKGSEQVIGTELVKEKGI